MAEYRAALKEKPDWPETLQKLGDVYKDAGRDDDAMAAYREAVRMKGENEALHYNLGILYEKKGLMSEVVEYRHSLKFAGEQGETRRRLGDIYSVRGSYPQAIEQYRELLNFPRGQSTHPSKTCQGICK